MRCTVTNQQIDHYLSVDLQKVKMLPEILGVKSAVFTQRIAAYNETFSPLTNASRSTANIWHRGLIGRNDEDISSATLKMLKLPQLLKQRNLSCGWTIARLITKTGHCWGVAASRKKRIVDKLPADRRWFWENFPSFD